MNDSQTHAREDTNTHTHMRRTKNINNTQAQQFKVATKRYQKVNETDAERDR